MRNYIYLFLFYFVNIFFIKSAESHINIVDIEVDKYFDYNWVNSIKNQRPTILVKMDKVKMSDVAELDDYDSTYKCEKDIKYKGNEYKIHIDVKKDHKLTYTILKKVEIGGEILYNNITDENDEKIFYDHKGIDKETNKKIYDKSPESTLKSYNWVLAKIKPKDEDNYFYVFINNIDWIVDGKTGYCCLGHWNKIEKFYFIYSKINYVDAISATLEGYSTYLVNIDLKGLNFNVYGDYNLSEWFENAADLKKIENFPKIDNEINIGEMLKGCENLEDVDLGENKIDNATLCFLKCENLKNVNLENVSITKDANLTNMFNYCKNLKEIKGIENLVKENDNPILDYMFTDCNIKGNLDLSKWGTNIKNCKNLFRNSNVKNLTLFNLKELLKNNRKQIEKYKKELNDLRKEYKNKFLPELSKISNNENLNNKILNYLDLVTDIKLNAEQQKEYEELAKDTEITSNYKNILENNKDLKDMYMKIKILFINIKKYENLDILKGSTIVELNINEEFMPDNKEDLNKILGSEYNITGDINIIKSNGEIVKYKNLDNYPYKEQKEQPDIPINPQIPEDIKEKEIPKPNPCCLCCATCFSKCCCCCKSKT